MSNGFVHTDTHTYGLMDSYMGILYPVVHPFMLPAALPGDPWSSLHSFMHTIWIIIVYSLVLLLRPWRCLVVPDTHRCSRYAQGLPATTPWYSLVLPVKYAYSYHLLYYTYGIYVYIYIYIYRSLRRHSAGLACRNYTLFFLH